MNGNTSSPDTHRHVISVVVPVYNEERNIESAYAAITDVFEALGERYELELLFTDNHSTDRSFEIIAGLAARDNRVKVLRFTRNFGFQCSILTGFRHARGDAALQIDCDLQDPPARIPDFVTAWETGADVVVGVRRSVQDPGLLRGLRRAFYWLMSRLSDDNLTSNAGDFRLLDRSILDQLRAIDDATPYVRGLVSTLARNQVSVPYERSTRTAGESKFPFLKLVGFAVDGILAHSIKPLRGAVYCGLATTGITAALIGFYLVRMFFFGAHWPEGLPTLTILILFGLSLNGIFLGIIGEYVGRIYLQVRRRPITVIERAVNLEPERFDG